MNSSAAARFFRLSAAALLIISSAGAAAYNLLKIRIATPEFKSFAEAKVGEFLGARVRISRVQLRLLNQIVLSGLEIELENKDTKPYQMQVEQIVFSYPWSDLLRGRFRLPAAIRLGHPKFVWNESHSSYAFFRDLKFSSSRMGGISDLEMAGGEIRLVMPGTDSEILFTEIQGAFKPSGQGRMSLDFLSQAEGLIQGRVRIQGEVDYENRTQRLNLILDAVQPGEQIPLPFETLSGKIRWEDRDWFFDEIRGRVHGWESTLKGSLLDFLGDPIAKLDIEVGRKEAGIHLNISADFPAQKIEGNLIPAGNRPFHFEGAVARQGREISFSRLKLDRGYQGEGRLDFGAGHAHFDFRKERQKIAVSTHLKRLDFYLQLALDHVKVLDLDLVTSTGIQLVPVIEPGQDRAWKFRGSFKSDYFILEYVPFQDFNGKFEIRPDGLRRLASSWGQVFEMRGDIFYRDKKPDADLTLEVKGFDLRKAREFAAKPLPELLAGVLEGKLKVEDDLRHPQISGNFSIKGGRVDRLEYDRAMVHFRGFPPYLPLYDSRILKGRTTVMLTGALDLSLENMLHGVELQTADKIILWKGWEVTRADTGADFEIGHPFSKLPMFALKGENGPQARTSVGSEAVQEDHYAAVGPKVKF